jgi:deoxyribodipyrimidine photolyase-like uncharacterized protein
MLDSEKLNDYIRKLARTYEMMQERTGRPNKYIFPEDVYDGAVSINIGLALHPFGDVIDLEKENITVRSAFLIPFVDNKIFNFGKFEDFYRMVDAWHSHELSFIEGQ